MTIIIIIIIIIIMTIITTIIIMMIMPIIVIVILIIMNGKLTKDILLSGSPYPLFSDWIRIESVGFCL